MVALLLIMLALTGSGERKDARTTETQLIPVLTALQKTEYLSSDTQEYREILTELIARAHLRLKVNINGETRSDSVNFLLLASDINEKPDLPLLFFTPLAQNLLHNCNYIGVSNTIICSQDFIDGFFNTYLRVDADVVYLPGPHPLKKDTLTVVTAKRAFIFWILGHELGHLVHGDLDSHFGTPLGIQGFGTLDELQQDKELKADSYCAELTVRRSIKTKRTAFTTNLEQILIALANDEVITRGLSPGQGVGLLKYYSASELIVYKNTGSHPEYVIRAARMLKLLAGLTKDAALNAMVDSFTIHLKQSGSEADKP
jgi:hypothetical protein